jgi:hypothetical protein
MRDTPLAGERVQRCNSLKSLSFSGKSGGPQAHFTGSRPRIRQDSRCYEDSDRHLLVYIIREISCPRARPSPRPSRVWWVPGGPSERRRSFEAGLHTAAALQHSQNQTSALESKIATPHPPRLSSTRAPGVRHRLRFTQRDERRLTLRAIGFYGGKDRRLACVPYSSPGC